MYIGQNFDVADAGESEVYAMDFRNDMQRTDQIVSAVWTLTVASGTDANPNSHRDGAPVVTSRTVTAQRISGLVAGVVYIVTCTVQTAEDNTIVLWSRIPCEVIE